MTEKLYTADEAIERLGIPRSTFFAKVKKGEIRKQLPHGKERGALYLIKDLDETTQREETISDAIFRRARPEDAQGMYELGERIMSRQGGYGIRPEKLLPFLSIPNSEIGHVLTKDNEIIGYFTLVPLTQEQLMRRLRKEVYIADFPPEELPILQPGMAVDIFVWEIMSDPEEKHVGQYLISKLLKFFQTLGKRGVEIEGIYSTATSIEGINLSRRMGMHLVDLPEVIQPNYMPFELKIQEQKNWITKNYILALESYRRRQERLQRNALSPLDTDAETSEPLKADIRTDSRSGRKPLTNANASEQTPRKSRSSGRSTKAEADTVNL